ncbi:MAG: hypothetical protein ACRETU_10720 [Steroidobacterales bacterium]
MRTPLLRVLAARIAWPVLLAGLVSCSSAGKLAGTSAGAADLSGTWKLNRDASDDPSKIFEKMRVEHGRGERTSRREDGGLGVPDERRSRGSSGGDEDNGGRGERRERMSPGDFFDGFSTGRGLLRITQSASAIVIDNGVSSRKFVPGAASVVSVKGGVADQQSGWDGKNFVVDTGGRQRPEVIERYVLSPDRKSLTIAIRINGHKQMPNAQWKLVYDAAPADTQVEGPST